MLNFLQEYSFLATVLSGALAAYVVGTVTSYLRRKRRVVETTVLTRRLDSEHPGVEISYGGNRVEGVDLHLVEVHNVGNVAIEDLPIWIRCRGDILDARAGGPEGSNPVVTQEEANLIQVRQDLLNPVETVRISFTTLDPKGDRPNVVCRQKGLTHRGRPQAPEAVGRDTSRLILALLALALVAGVASLSAIKEAALSAKTTRAITTADLLDEAWDLLGGQRGTDYFTFRSVVDPQQLEVAKRKIEAALTIDPRNARALRCKGVHLLTFGKTEEAIEVLRQAVALDPQNPGPHNSLGTAYQWKGNHEEAASAFRKVLQLDPTYKRARFNLALVLKTQGETEKAISELRELVETDDRFFQAWYLLGKAYHEEGQLTLAIRAYREALTVNSELHGAYRLLGIALHQNGQSDEGLANLRTAVRVKADYADGWTSLVCALEARGSTDEAKQIRERADLFTYDCREVWELTL